MSAALPHVRQTPSVGLLDILAALLRRRWWIISGTTLVVAACVAYALLTTPIYRATTVLVPAGSSGSLAALGSALGQLGGLASLVGGIGLGSDEMQTEEALAVLQSREFTERFIRDKELLPQLFKSIWDERAKAWTVPAEAQPTLAKGYKYFTRRVLAVDKDRKTGLVRISVNWRERNEAAEWTNEMITRLNAEMRTRAAANASASIAHLEREREATQLVETRNAINRVIESQIQRRMMAAVTQDYAFRVVDRALPPDADDIWAPRRFRLVLLGLVGGFLVSCGTVLGIALMRGELGPRAMTEA